ncbi:MAG: hypothetical protein ACYDGR_06730 [Candidatus Dormibacteria bacterium]
MAGLISFAAMHDRAVRELVLRRAEERASAAPLRVLDRDGARPKGSGGRAPREWHRPALAALAAKGEPDADSVERERVRLYASKVIKGGWARGDPRA